MNPLHLLRMARWARHPPSRNRVLLGLAVIAVCLAIVGLEWAGFWPDWASGAGRAARIPRLP